MKNVKLFFIIILIISLTLVTGVGCEIATQGNRPIEESDIKEENGDADDSVEDVTGTTEEIEDRTNHVEAIVSMHQLATEAGLDILTAGGTAADAAIAVAAVMTVVEPFFSSVLGGGTWALYYSSETGEVTSLDGVGPVGSKATVEDYAARGGEAGMHQSNVPGAWDGWMLWLEEYGLLDLDEILEPAIRIAREGYPVSRSMATWLDRQKDLIPGRPDTAKIYMPEGRLLQEGETVYQNDLANTFEDLESAYSSMIDDGRSEAIQAARDYYYRGPIAEAIVEFSDENNGYLTLSDFNNFEAEIVEPVSIQYNDEIEVFENPPNSQGITMLIALNILKGFDFSELGPNDADAVHLQAEAIKLAFADRYYHIGDPDLTDVPVAELLSEEHANEQRALIDMENAMEWPIPDILTDDSESNNTTTFHIVDQYGNAAAVTTSLGAQFLVIGDTGIHINNRMRMISLEDGNPNQLTPGYKVRHTSNPYMVLKNGKVYILGGNTGADNQSQTQVQQVINIVEFGFSAQEAVETPRFASTAFPAGTFPYDVLNNLRMQEGFPADLQNELRVRGHNIEVGGAFGSAGIIIVDEDGLNANVGADPNVSTSYGFVIPVKNQ